MRLKWYWVLLIILGIWEIIAIIQNKAMQQKYSEAKKAAGENVDINARQFKFLPSPHGLLQLTGIVGWGLARGRSPLKD